MTTMRRTLRSAAIGAAALASLIGAAGAQAWTGDWTISGEFARSTNPSFYGGFNPNDLAAVDATFDNRGKSVALHLEYFQAPERGTIDVAFGTGRTDGTCDTGLMDIGVTARDIVGPSHIEYAYTYSRYAPPSGSGWTYVGRVDYREHQRYQWVRLVSGLDTANHERVASLTLDGVDGQLTTVTRVANTATEMDWSFASPLLNDLQANCVEVYVPGHTRPYVVAPPASAPDPAPVPTPAPAPAPTPDPGATAPTDPAAADEVSLDDIVTTATRQGGRVVLRMSGTADQVQIRIRRASKTVDFRSTIAVRNAPAEARFVQVRFSDGTDWSSWDRIAIK